MTYRVRVMTLVPAYVDLVMVSTSPGEAESAALAEVKDEGRQQRYSKVAGEKWVGGDYEWTIVDDLNTGDLDPTSLWIDDNKTELIDA